MLTAAGVVLGLVVGSFLGVVADRLPAGAAVVRGRSRCDACGRSLGTRELVPVASWLALRGRCRTCRAVIPVRSTVVEIATAASFAAMAWRFGLSWELGGYLVLAAALVVLTAIDARTRRLPREVIHVAAALGAPFLVAGALVADEPGRLGWAAVGGLGALAFFLLLHVGWAGAMGDGDVRLAGLLGVFLGWIGPLHVPVGLFLGFVAGAAVGVVLLAAGRATRRSALPFGPFMAAGALAAIVWGRTLIAWWL